MRELPKLPILDALPALRDALASHCNVLLEAPPGAGKSTVAPLTLLEAGWRGDGRIVMLEPRRIAARAVAQRMANLLGEETGRTVGFRTRLETRVGPQTRIEVVTEGVLTRMLQHDPAIEDVACVIFDEFHERNLQGDLGLALALDCQRHLRETLRLLVMSATLDGEALLRLLGDAAVVRSPGRMYDVETRFLPPPRSEAARGTRIEAAAITATLRALHEHEGDALVFLPGAAEIRRVIQGLGAHLSADDFSLLPLYGDLPAAEQDAALGPDPRGRRRVIAATNIAETSLTIDGVRIVVDAGVERRQRFDPATGMSRLETARISRSSADQRRGRAGRTAPGVCYRLWSETTQDTLLPQAPAEILEADLAPLALELACWGCDEPAALAWLDPPPQVPLAQARDLLARLEAVDEQGRVTALGRDMAALGLHPRLAHMALRARPLGLGALACRIAALLTERDPLRAAPGSRDPDLFHRLEVLQGRPAPPGLEVDAGTVRRIERIAGQVERQLARGARNEAPDPQLSTEEATGLLLAFAYPDRIGRTRDGSPGRYLLSGGRGASFMGPTALARSGYIVVASLDAGDREARIQLAASLDPRLLERHFGAAIEESSFVAWDPKTEAVAARRTRRLGAVVLDDDPLRDVDASSTLAAMLEGIRAMGLGCLPWTRDLEQWRTRVALVRAHDPRGPSSWPDVNDQALLDGLEAWLAPWLTGVTRRAQLAKVDLRAALHGLLDFSSRRRLDELAPTHLAVPSGSRIAIDYSGAAPTLSVKLQEMFGLAESPAVVQGKVPVTIELLSPARRPVQVTRDLASFWARGYHEVRKELKGRYPKHYWPDDPREAVATRRVRPRDTD